MLLCGIGIPFVNITSRQTCKEHVLLVYSLPFSIAQVNLYWGSTDILHDNKGSTTPMPHITLHVLQDICKNTVWRPAL